MKQNASENRLISKRTFQSWERSLPMEKTVLNEPLFRVWVDTRRRIVSFHEEEGCKLLEFRSREMFLNCVDQYTGMQYRYQ